jgi:DNA-directed RNA polymerase subunit L
MEVKILEKEKNRLKIEIAGEDHTFLNALKKELNNDKDIQISAYRIDHPLASKPEMLIEGKDPLKSLTEANKRLKAEYEKVQKAF